MDDDSFYLLQLETNIMDAKVLAVAQSISSSMESLVEILDAVASQMETLIGAGIKQNRRVEGLLADLIELSASPQLTQIERDRSGQVVSSTRTIACDAGDSEAI